MRSFTHQTSNDMITCTWKGHHIIGDKFEVKVTWKNDDELLSGTIEWRGGGKYETIEEVCFPVAGSRWPCRAGFGKLLEEDPKV